MPKTKISEFSATPANNTDIDSINIAEGCAPSGINDAIRELMAQLKDFQTGAVGDSFNGPVGTTTAAAGAFTTLSSTGNTTLGDASGDSVTINGTATFANANPTLSAGTANGVTYLNGSKVVTSGSALVFDGTNLGVGVSPASDGAIHVHRAGASFPTIKITNGTTGTGNLDGFDLICGSGGEAYVYNRENQPILFGVNNSEQMRLTSTGLGIGTSSPASKLAVVGEARVYTGSNLGYWGVDGGNNYVYFGSNSSGYSLSFQTGGADRMRLDTSGNLGLGVTPTSNSLGPVYQNKNAVFVADGSTPRFWLGANWYNNSGDKYLVNGFASLYSQQSGQHIWWNAPTGTAGNAITFTQAMSLTADGTLLVGKTAVSDSTVGFQVEPSGRVLTASSASTSAENTFIVYSTGASAYRFYVGLNGTINATSTTISAISDQRLKENIRDLDEGLATVMALKPRKFDWKEGKGKDIKNDRGWIAQEFETVFPDMIEQWQDPAPEGEDPYKAVNANLIPTLVKAMQEQQAIIESLKARLDAANL